MNSKIITSKSFHLKYLKILGCMAGLLAGVNPAHAATPDEELPPWYEIEVIIFSNNDQVGLESETWPDEVVTRSYEDVHELRFADEVMDEAAADPMAPPAQPSTPRLPKLEPITDSAKDAGGLQTEPVMDTPPEPIVKPYVYLEADELKLTDSVKKIERSSRHEVLLHIGWRQPTLPPDQSIPVFVYEGMTQREPSGSTNMLADSTTATRGMLSPDPNSPTIIDQTGNRAYTYMSDAPAVPDYRRLWGTLRLSVSRYLHVESDLHLRLPFIIEEEVILPNNNAEQPDSEGFSSFFGVAQPEQTTTILREREIVKDFRLAESRRLRSSEIHYLDHPLFGVIFHVIPFEAYPQPEENEELVR